MNRRSWFLSMAALASMVILILLYLLVRGYVHSQVEKRVRDTMLETRAFHQYVQNDMHPAYYKLMAEGDLKQGFYAPELLSSSFIARNMQQYYNEERRKAKLPEVTYKIASGNPRNSLNKATEFEQTIINWFNQDKTRSSYSKIRAWSQHGPL